MVFVSTSLCLYYIDLWLCHTVAVEHSFIILSIWCSRIETIVFFSSVNLIALNKITSFLDLNIQREQISCFDIDQNRIFYLECLMPFKSESKHDFFPSNQLNYMHWLLDENHYRNKPVPHKMKAVLLMCNYFRFN